LNYFLKIFTKLIAIFVVFFALSYGVKADDKLTQFKLLAGGSLNANLYLSDFSRLNDYPMCCTSFDFAVSPSYGAFIGGEYLFEKDFLGVNYSVDLLLSYQNLSADYSIEEKLANIITGNDYVEAYSEHNLDVKIKSFFVEPGLNIYPLNKISLSFRLGMQLGLLNDLTFSHYEKIIKPDWITFKETGTNTRAEFSGDIPNATKIYTAVSLSVAYELIKANNFSISGFLKYNLGLNNIASDLDWKISTFQAGISLGYRIPKPKNIPPMDAPMPQLPEFPKPKEMLVDLRIKADDKLISNNDTIKFNVKERKFINKYILLPVVFYKINTTQMLISDNKSRSEEEAQKNAYLSAIQYLRDNPNVNLTLFSSAISTEPQDTVEKRLNDLKNMILQSGIAQDRVKVNYATVDAGKLTREELFQDNCYIRFGFSDGTEIISYRSDTTQKFIVEPVKIEIETEVVSDCKIKEFSGNVSAEKKVLHSFPQGKSHFMFKADDLKLLGNKLEFEAKATDIMEMSKTVKYKIPYSATLITDGVFENVISDFEETNYVRQFTLGYCEFDKAEFSYVNKNAVQQISKAYQNGELVEIIPLYDFLGTEEHNLRLANARASSAIALLGLNKDKVQINIPKDYFFSNENPYGRMMNRAVIVRIKNISDK
jgi:hypothetical protein